MKTLKLFIAAAILMSCNLSHGQYNHDNLKIKTAVNDTSQFDASYNFRKLRLYPVIANDVFREEHRDIGKYTLLKDAIEGKKIVVSETGASISGGNNQVSDGRIRNPMNSNSDVSGTVNTLFAENISSDTIFIMAGEVVKGGKQDRVIGEDIVIPPGQKVNLSAFCVEHNRWTTKDGNQGQFTGYYNVSSMDIRKIVTEDKNQQSVWNKVDEHTRLNNAQSSTSTYTNLENSEGYQKELAAYMEKFGSVFSSDSTVIGVIAVTGDKVIGCDLFATHQLFTDAFNNLLHSYVGYAIAEGAEVSMTDSDVFVYLDKILNNESKQTESIEQNGMEYNYKGNKLHIATY